MEASLGRMQMHEARTDSNIAIRRYRKTKTLGYIAARCPVDIGTGSRPSPRFIAFVQVKSLALKYALQRFTSFSTLNSLYQSLIYRNLMPYDTGKDIADGNASRTSVSDLEDSPLTGNEEQRFQLKQHRKCRPQWPANDSPIWKVWSLIMTVCSLLLLLSTVIHRNNPKPEILASCRTTSPLENYPHPVETWKKENLIETKYYRDLRYMTLDHEADYLWREHVLMATGNIRVPSEDGEENGTLMSISMFHQLHCLAKMRLALQQAREGIDIGVDWRDDAHWPHCFDYLRSSIMCFADGTLERVTLQPGPRDDGTFVKIIDGGVETRYCRDTRPLYELERQYGPNSHYGHDAAEEFQVAPGR